MVPTVDLRLNRTTYTMSKLSAAAITLSLSLLPAQGPTLVPKIAPLVSIRADQVPEILKQWPTTALGKLFTDEEALRAAKLGKRFTHSQFTRQTEVALALSKIEIGDRLRPYDIARMHRPQEDVVWRLLEHPANQVQSVELHMIADPERGLRGDPWMIRTMQCLPQFSGRWARQFEDEARARQSSLLFKHVEGGTLDGFDAHVFAIPEDILQTTNWPHCHEQWMLQLPGTQVYGYCPTNGIGKIKTQVERTDAEISLSMDLAKFNEMIAQSGRGVPGDFEFFGFDKLKSLKWSGHFKDGLLVDVLDVVIAGKPSGIVAAILGGEGQLPAQALPEGALAQLRAAIDLESILTSLAKVDDDFELPANITQRVLTALDGSMAIACCSPAPGGLIPRLFATLNIADQEALDGLLAMLEALEVPLKKLAFDGVEVTALKIPDFPQGIQPAWCKVGDKLHIAESARSLRAFLKAQKSGAEAMDVDGMKAPGGAGEALHILDLRFDVAEIYKNFYQTWLPLFEATNSSQLPAPVRRSDLPEPEYVEEILGKGRGVIRRDGDRYSLIQQSATGGIETTAILFTWSTMLSQEMSSYNGDQLSKALADSKLEQVHQHLERFRERAQRWPKDLAELYTKEDLADDALLMPADDLAEPITLGDGRIVRSSFRYFPTPIQVIGLEGEHPALLVEIRPHGWSRAALTTEGTTPDLAGYACKKPIDQIGKASQGSFGR